MAVPRNRLSNARKRNRRSHHAKSPVQLVGCDSCGTPKVPHRLCLSCGTYRGEKISSREDG